MVVGGVARAKDTTVYRSNKVTIVRDVDWGHSAHSSWLLLQHAAAQHAHRSGLIYLCQLEHKIFILAGLNLRKILFHFPKALLVASRGNCLEHASERNLILLACSQAMHI